MHFKRLRASLKAKAARRELPEVHARGSMGLKNHGSPCGSVPPRRASRRGEPSIVRPTTSKRVIPRRPHTPHRQAPPPGVTQPPMPPKAEPEEDRPGELARLPRSASHWGLTRGGTATKTTPGGKKGASQPQWILVLADAATTGSSTTPVSEVIAIYKTGYLTRQSWRRASATPIPMRTGADRTDGAFYRQ